VLTLSSAAPDGLDDEARAMGGTLAAYAAVAASFTRDRDELRRREAALHRALNTRDVIGQAKGILMERNRMTAGQAFDVLRNTSQRLNRKLGDVAERLAESGTLPE
jgi:AmiR/NasT family two-component response regulator